jgi:hypothetical protein
MTSTGKVQRVRRPLFLALLVSAVAVACAVKMVTVTGPDGNQWLTCEGNDAKCVETIGTKCPNGYVLGHNRLFNCKPDPPNNRGPCVTDRELETISAAGPLAQVHPYGTGGAMDEVKLVRGPDCRIWVMCQSFAVSHDPLGSAPACLNLVGQECRNGYIEAEVFGQAIYKCKAPPDTTGLPDAVAPSSVNDSQ